MKDLCVKESYEKNGETKTSWNKIGVMFGSNGKEYIKLFHMPGILISVFEKKDKQQPQSAQEAAGMDDESNLPF